jgi:CRISPR system Cascade subunit CasC
MKHLELHILQSVPVACLNRDDLNSPKTAIFGGVQRARVSSQCWKRAVRELAAEDEQASVLFRGERSRLFVSEIAQRLQGKKMPDDGAKALASCAGHYLAKLDPKQDGKVKTLVFLSPAEFGAIAEVLSALDDADKKKLVDGYAKVDTAKLAAEEDDDDDDAGDEVAPSKGKAEKGEKGDKKLSPKQFTKLVSGVLARPMKAAFKGQPVPKDASDIAIFGRMVANDPTLAVEAAAMFSHALSVHKVDNEIDFFSAVDDLQDKDETGAGMTGTLEFNSATYYRFAALNLGMLFDETHLHKLTQVERKSVVRTFVEATIKAIPGARKNTMNGNTLPIYVLAVVREKGHPIQLVNAFEDPIRPKQGYGRAAIVRLQDQYRRLKMTWGLESALELAVRDTPVDDTATPTEGGQAGGRVPEVNLRELLDGRVANPAMKEEGFKGILHHVV